MWASISSPAFIHSADPEEELTFFLEFADLQKADLREANLTNASTLTQHQLDQACVDDKTILPEGLTQSMCYSLERADFEIGVEACGRGDYDTVYENFGH